MLLFPQVVPGPVLFPRIVHNREYSLFIQNVPLPLWIANASLLAVAVINLAIVACLCCCDLSFKLRRDRYRRNMPYGGDIMSTTILSLLLLVSRHAVYARESGENHDHQLRRIG